MRSSGLIVGALLLAMSAAAMGQTSRKSLEVSPFYGYLFGGEAYDFDPLPGRIEIAGHAVYGLRVGYRITSHVEPEVRWSHTDTTLRDTEPLVGLRSPLKLDYFLGGIAYNFLSDRVQPYALLSAGAARFDPTYRLVLTTGSIEFERITSTRFTGVVGLGVKGFITPVVGLRVEALGHATRTADIALAALTCTSSSSPAPGGPVVPKTGLCPAKSWLLNGEVSTGLVLAF